MLDGALRELVTAHVKHVSHAMQPTEMIATSPYDRDRVSDSPRSKAPLKNTSDDNNTAQPEHRCPLQKRESEMIKPRQNIYRKMRDASARAKVVS